jgi:hypothetical protein
LWKKGLAEYDDLEGIAWLWQSIYGTVMKALLAQKFVRTNLTDRASYAASVQLVREFGGGWTGELMHQTAQ